MPPQAERKLSVYGGQVNLPFFFVFGMALFFVRDYLLRQFLLCTANRFDHSLGIDPILSAPIQNTFQIGTEGMAGLSLYGLFMV